MENELQSNKSESLIGELANWNRQESKFREIFSDEALKDPEFLKMKLENYDRLYYKYSDNVRTPDDRAMMTMLRFQRTKIEKALYPGLISRLLHKITRMIKANWTNLSEQKAQIVSSQQPSYHNTSIPVPANSQRENKKQEAQQNAPQQKVQPYNGVPLRNRQKHRHRSGRSL